jgi:rod shape determining protein RodA
MLLGERGVFNRLDFLSLALMGLLSVISLFVIRQATVSAVASDPLYYVKRQIIWIVLGTIVMLVVVAIPYTNWSKLAKYLYWVSIGMLGLVIVHGHSALGASRWIGTSSIQIQPSEFAKAIVIITLAYHLNKKESLKRWRDLVSPIAHVGLPMLLILKQPDLGTSLVFLAILVTMLYMAGAPGWRLLIIFGGGMAFVIFWIWAHLHLTIGHHHIPLPLMHNYQLKRLLIFLNPNSDPLGAGFNVIQSRIAVGTGGLWGSGIFGAPPSQLSFLPESSTDFIFAVVAETLGFVGSTAVLFLYFLLIARGLSIAATAKDRLGTLMAAGVVAMFAFHVIESVGMATGVMPVAGVPLPFMSYGGSAYLTDAIGMGILMNVYVRRRALMFEVSRPTQRQTGTGAPIGGA